VLKKQIAKAGDAPLNYKLRKMATFEERLDSSHIRNPAFIIE